MQPQPQEPQTLTRYRVQYIEQHEFHLKSKEHGFLISSEEINFQLSFALDWQREKQLIIVQILLKYLDKRDSSELLFLNISFGYFIDNYEAVVKHVDEETKTNNALLLNLLNTSIDMLRGIVFARTDNSYLSQTLLASMDARVLIDHIKKFPDGDGTKLPLP